LKAVQVKRVRDGLGGAVVGALDAAEDAGAVHLAAPKVKHDAIARHAGAPLQGSLTGLEEPDGTSIGGRHEAAQGVGPEVGGQVLALELLNAVERAVSLGRKRAAPHEDGVDATTARPDANGVAPHL